MISGPLPEDEPARLQTLGRYVILDTMAEQEFDDATALASYICGTPISLISLVDQKRQWFKSRVGLDVSETSRAESFCAHTLTEPGTLIVEDALRDPRFAENPLVLGDPNIRFYAGAPLIAPNGHVLGTLCVIDTKPRDLAAPQVAALEALARQVMALFESRLRLLDNRKAADALLQSEKLAAVGRLASSIAHEINNPLEAITNLLYLSRRQAILPEVKDLLDQAEIELRRVSIVANQKLRFHKQALEPRAVPCASLVSSTLALYESRLQNAGIVVQERMRVNPPVECWEADISQVLGNLLANAVDAMPNGGRLLVRSRKTRDGKTGGAYFALTVADTGTGMALETRHNAFQPFFTTKGIGGSGLGLWLSKTIMERHGGKISIRSTQRYGCPGTVVVLHLPLRDDVDSPACPPADEASCAWADLRGQTEQSPSRR
jgi:two-component system, NtrC family, sensor kinase